MRDKAGIISPSVKAWHFLPCLLYALGEPAARTLVPVDDTGNPPLIHEESSPPMLIHRVPKGPPIFLTAKTVPPTVLVRLFCPACRAHSTIATPKRSPPLPLVLCLFYGSCRQCIFPFVGERAYPPPLSLFTSLLIFSQLLFIFSFFFLANQSLSKVFFFPFEGLQGLDVSFMLAITIVLPTFVVPFANEPTILHTLWPLCHSLSAFAIH